MMTPMMNKILSSAIDASKQGCCGYAVQQAHYEKYRGMKKIVDRLIVTGMVDKREADAGQFYLVPTAQAHQLMQDNPQAA